MSAVPRVLKWSVSALVVVLVGVAVAGGAHAGFVYARALLGATFLVIYFGGSVYAENAHENSSVPHGQRRDHRVATIWLLALTVCWAGLLAVSSNALWLAFPLTLLQVGILGVAWGSAAAFITSGAATIVAVLQLPPEAPLLGAVLGPFLGATVAVTFMWGITTIARESRARKEALEELQATRTLLARAEEEQLLIQERQRLAGELHDTVSQGLSATAMLLRAAQTTTSHNAKENLLRQALEATEANLVEARRITTALAPRELTNARLPNALRGLATEPHVPHLFVNISEGPFDLSLEEEAVLLRVAQSALWNVREHSGATRAEVNLSQGPAEILLEVMDNGHGFDGSQQVEEGRGVGLRSMRSRMESVGGQLTITSAETGTLVRAMLPHLAEEGHHEDSTG